MIGIKKQTLPFNLVFAFCMLVGCYSNSLENTLPKNTSGLDYYHCLTASIDTKGLHRMSVSGDFAIFTSSEVGYLGVIDISSEAIPKFLGWLQVSDDEIIAFTMRENHLYALTAGRELIVTSLEKPCDIESLSKKEVGGQSKSIKVNENYIALMGFSEELDRRTLYILSTDMYEYVATVNLDVQNIGSWSIQGSKIFIVSYDNQDPELIVVDIHSDSSQTSPYRIPDSKSELIYINQNDVYVQSERHGIRKISVEDSDLITAEIATNQYLFINGFRVADGYIIMTYHSCDGGECADGLYILSSNNGREIYHLPLLPEIIIKDAFIEDGIVYALTEKQLIGWSLDTGGTLFSLQLLE